MTTIQNLIEHRIAAHFDPVFVEIVNESHMHNVPPGSESHFKVVLVSQGFEGQSAVKRHQSVYAVLAVELQSGVHALALHTYLPTEWEKRQSVPSSPNCLGGSK